MGSIFNNVRPFTIDRRDAFAAETPVGRLVLLKLKTGSYVNAAMSGIPHCKFRFLRRIRRKLRGVEQPGWLRFAHSQTLRGALNVASKKFCIPRIFGSARAARQSAQTRSAPLHLATWEQLASF
jgi:hypothetical protein